MTTRKQKLVSVSVADPDGEIYCISLSYQSRQAVVLYVAMRDKCNGVQAYGRTDDGPAEIEFEKAVITVKNLPFNDYVVKGDSQASEGFCFVTFIKRDTVIKAHEKRCLYWRRQGPRRRKISQQGER